jgi:hypothetical protein
VDAGHDDVEKWEPGSSARSGGRIEATGPSPEEPRKEAVVIQFVADDRGGCPRAQLQIPREEKKIREAVELGTRRAAFLSAPSVFAASLDEVIRFVYFRG